MGSAWHCPAAGYGLAAAAVLIAGALQWLLTSAAAPLPAFPLFFPAVLFAAIIAGRAAGLFATALAVLVADVLFIEPVGSLLARHPADWLGLALFSALSVLLCLFAGRLRSHPQKVLAAAADEISSMVLDSVDEGVIVTDASGRLALLNRAAEMLLDCRSEEVRGRELSSILTLKFEHSGELVPDVVATIVRQGSLGAADQNTRLLMKDGREIPIDLNGALLRVGGGPVLGAVISFRDCTERNRTEHEIQRLLAAVQAEKEWLSLVLASINEEVYFTDTEGRYTFANPTALREFGHTSVQGVQVEKLIANLVVLRPDGSPRPLAEAPPLRALAGEIVQDEEQIVKTPRTGMFRNRLCCSAPVKDAQGRIIGAVSVVRDITELKRVETALREADHRKNIFLATLAHELRNPLAPLRTAAEVLASPALSAADLERCRLMISRQVTHMASLLDDLLDVSRFTRGDLTLKRSHVPLQQILDAAIETAQPLLAAKRHQLSVQVPQTPLVLEVDPVRLTQVVSNLLTNAAKYTPAGGRIGLNCLSDEQSFRIVVTDTGIGLAPEQFADIFKMFVQAQSPSERGEGGLGIGLALIKGLVELHGGRIEVDSPGRGLGSAFTVTLPSSVVVARELLARKSEPEGGLSVPAGSVLIADDNVDAAEALAMLLEHSGHEVHIAHTGDDALRLALQVRPAVALLDIGMPGLSGYEVAARLRREAWGARMTLVALTGWGQAEDRRKARAAGFDHHLTKPADPAQIEAILGSQPWAPRAA